jgi:hypothetical protein
MTTMTRWSPFTPRFHFRHNVDEMLRRLLDGAAEGADGNASCDPKDVEVTLMDDVLTIKGERRPDHDTTDKDYFVREITYGTFRRSFTLPQGVDPAQVKAKYANGMLEVSVPSPRAAMPTTIEIKAA